jgi:hypothetical protein
MEDTDKLELFTLAIQIQVENKKQAKAGLDANFKKLIDLLKRQGALTTQMGVNNAWSGKIKTLEKLQKKLRHYRKTGEYLKLAG